MATHSSVLAWRIPGTGEPRGLSSMGSHRVGHDRSDLAAAATAAAKGSIAVTRYPVLFPPSQSKFSRTTNLNNPRACVGAKYANLVGDKQI